MIRGRPPERQINDRALLTAAQGKIDGDDAVRDADSFGFGPGSPICLDLELETFEHEGRGSIAYICGWCEEVRRQGRRPGVYTNKPTFVELADDKRCVVGGLQVDINVADSDCLVGGSGAMALRAQPVPKEDEMVIMITAPAKAPRAIVGSKLIGFQSAADRQSFIAAWDKADVPIIDWQCSVSQYNATSGIFGD